MKKFFDFKNIVFLFFILAWPMADLYYIPRIRYFLFALGFVVSLALIYFIKNKGVSVLAVFVLTIGMSIYSLEYSAFFLQPLLLAAASKEAIDTSVKSAAKKSDSLSGIYLTLCVLSSVLQIIYAIKNKNENEHDFSGNLDVATSCIMLFFVIMLFVLLFVKTITATKQDKSKFKNVSAFKSIYFISLVLIIISVAVFYSTAVYFDILHVKITFYGWYLYIVTMFLYDDPFVSNMGDGLKNAIDRFIKGEKEN